MITIILDLPHKDLHPNARPHRWAKAKAVKAARHYAYLVAKSQAPKTPFKKAIYEVTWYLPRVRDYDNLNGWLKAYLDGFQDAGIVVNDSELRPGPVTRFSGKGATGGHHRVEITIKEDVDTPLLAGICHACFRPLGEVHPSVN